MNDRNYRNSDKPPVPFHAIDSGLAASMHAEIRLLYGLLCDVTESLFSLTGDTFNEETVERAIARRIQEEEA
jgi:hypothetical protein